MSTDSHYERIQSTIRKIGAKAYYTQAINARLKDCKKGHWLEGHIAVTVENAEAAEMEYELQPNGMARIYA